MKLDYLSHCYYDNMSRFKTEEIDKYGRWQKGCTVVRESQDKYQWQFQIYINCDGRRTVEHESTTASSYVVYGHHNGSDESLLFCVLDRFILAETLECRET